MECYNIMNIKNIQEVYSNTQKISSCANELLSLSDAFELVGNVNMSNKLYRLCGILKTGANDIDGAIAEEVNSKGVIIK